MTTFIYALVDPRTDKEMYVGKANDPRARLAAHLRSAGKPGNAKRSAWLLELRALGMSPRVVILQEVDVSEWEAAEKRWISEMRARQPDLTNASTGGGSRPDKIDKKTTGVIVRVTSAERASIKHAAAKAGMSVSAWIRWRAVEGVRAPS